MVKCVLLYVQCVYSQGIAPSEARNAGEGEMLTYPKVDMLCFWPLLDRLNRLHNRSECTKRMPKVVATPWKNYTKMGLVLQ